MKRTGGELSSVENFSNYLEVEKMSYKVEQRKLLLKLCNKGLQPSRESLCPVEPQSNSPQSRGTSRAEEAGGTG